MLEERIENIINESLNGDAQKNALDFAEFLNENEMIYTGVHCEMHYKGEVACFILVDVSSKWHSPWSVWTAGADGYIEEYEGFPIDERTKEIAWENISHCCNRGCCDTPHKSKVIFGKKFESVCNAVMMFRNPAGETLECLKKLVLMQKHSIDIKF